MVAKAARVASAAAGVVALGALLLAGGCRTTTNGETESGASASAPPAAATSGVPGSSAAGHEAGRSGLSPWPIDPARTVVTILVRRAGALARLGHDHVITSTDEAGTVWVGATPASSSFELRLPVAGLEVDLPDARAAAGPEFAAPVPDDARAGTRRNMLRAEVLDADRYPSIALRSVAASGDWAQAIVRVTIELHGVTREQSIPVTVERGPQGLQAQGVVRLNQTDFGITPFTVGGGIIQVADALEVRFTLAAAPP